MEMKVKMKRRRREREREREREEREGKKRRDGEAKHRHGPQTVVLLREPLSRSQTVACAAVQAGAFKALASLAPPKKLAQRLDSLVRVSRRVERDQKKKSACELVHHRRCSKWPPLARTHAKHL